MPQIVMQGRCVHPGELAMIRRPELNRTRGGEPEAVSPLFPIGP